MQQIADWLESLGTSEYPQGFAENRIDISVLLDLTDQDPKTSAWSSGIAGKCRGQSPSRMARHRSHPRRKPLMPAVPPVATATPPPISSTREAADERRYLMLTSCWQLDASKCSSQYRNLSDAVTLINSGVLRNPERKRR
jgi:hypothetical protein